MPIISNDPNKQHRQTVKERFTRAAQVSQQLIDEQRRQATMQKLRETLPKNALAET